VMMLNNVIKILTILNTQLKASLVSTGNSSTKVITENP
jgi:hypothetical protein